MINQVGRKEIHADRQNMSAAKSPEEETRAAACRLTALPLRSPAWARGGAGRWWEHSGENEAIGDVYWEIPSLRGQLPPLHILLANCSPPSRHHPPAGGKCIIKENAKIGAIVRGEKAKTVLKNISISSSGFLQI